MEIRETLKSVVVGGYDKEGVLQYIELLLETAQEETGKLKGELSQVRALNDNLSEQNQRLHTQYHELADSMQGFGRNMDTILAENRALTAQVECYRTREAEVETLYQDAEATANDLLQDAQAEAWRIEQESRLTLAATECRVTELLAAAESEQECITYRAALRREEVAQGLEVELRAMVTLARSIGALGAEAEDILLPHATAPHAETPCEVLSVAALLEDASPLLENASPRLTNEAAPSVAALTMDA